MVKKAKDGEKRKAVKTRTAPIQAYDLETISAGDLKKYITSLQKELALMRKDCQFYSKNGDKIMDFVESRRNVYRNQKHTSVANNFGIDDTIERFRDFPAKFNEKAMLKDREKARLRMENELEGFIARATAEADHLDKEHVLKQQIADKVTRIEYDQYLSVMTLLDMAESCRKSLETMDVKSSKKMASILLGTFDKHLKINQEFSADKIRKFMSIWGTGYRFNQGEMEESYITDIKRMQEFFCDISSTNAEIIKMLREKLTNLLIERKKVDLNLNQLLSQNKGLKDPHPPRFSYSNSLSARASHGVMDIQEQKFIKLQYKNEALIQLLRMKQDDLQCLKKQFIVVMRKIYQKAEFKAFMFEEAIRLARQLESLASKEEEPKPVKPTASRKNRNIRTSEDRVNVMKLRVENSDTLFVPPVYHEF